MRAAERGTTGNRPAGLQTSTGLAGGGDAGGEPPALTIVVPAFNESARLEVGMRRLQAAVDSGDVDPATTELVVVDDGSTDGTAARARELYAHLPHLRVVVLPANAGKGAAIRAGVATAQGRNLAFMDADMAIDPHQIPRMVEALTHADLAIGSRSLPGSSAEGDTFGRTVMGWVFNRAVNAVTHVGLGDTQCGFKAFRTPVARLLFGSTAIDRFAFDVEILLVARRFGLRVAEVPVRWRNVQGSRIRPLRDAWSMVGDMVRSRLGLLAPPPIEALEVAAGGGPVAAVQRTVGPTVPVLARADGSALVLFPLVTPEDIRPAARRLEADVGAAGVHRRLVSLDQLAAMRPLRVLPGTAANRNGLAANGRPAPGAS